MAALLAFSCKMHAVPECSVDLLKTCCLVDHDPWKQWMSKEYSRLTHAVVTQSTSRIKSLEQKLTEIMKELATLPESSKEGAFQTSVGEKMNFLSSSSTLLKKRVEELQGFLDVLAEDAGEDVEETAKLLQSRIGEAKAVAQSIVTTLCFYAALTLFRSSNIGGKSEQSKKGATDLNSLLATCFSELEQTNPCKWLDEASMEEVLVQMGELVPRPNMYFVFSQSIAI
jgi:hypothetical protein